MAKEKQHVNHKIQRLIAWYVAAILLTACAATTANVSQPLSDMSLRTLQPCAPPCWHGIIPGQSNAADVRRILPTLPFIRPGSIEEQPYPEGNGSYFSWAYRNFGELGAILLINDTVVHIDTQPGFQLELGEVVERFGPPARFFPRNVRRPHGSYYSISLYYPDRGLVFNTPNLPGLPLDAKEYSVRPDFSVYSVDYLVPGTVEELIRQLEPPLIIDFAIQNSLPWQGFGTFPGSLPPSQ